ncbi:hypothetical protein RJ639_019412 [Escallonia herrerae]|uniref:Retrovirus-related Pol polyprotein from transposon RE1 n=1 Tax=Escallonia herrerae TaxID=1293975 RepID=A0AA88VBH7_9ASTE|nr:hypothetical protein RJ639_019412 [Escallonia herrerae]
MHRPALGDSTYANWELNNSIVMAWLINSMESHISRTYLFLRTTKTIWDAVNKNYFDLENASQVFEIKNKLKEMHQGNLGVTEYYNELQTLWQELDMHYEADWGDLEGNLKFKRHLEKERLYEFLTSLNRELDEVREGFCDVGLCLPLMKHLPKCVVKLAGGVLCLEEKNRLLLVELESGKTIDSAIVSGGLYYFEEKAACEFDLKDLGALRPAETPMEPNAKLDIEGGKDVDREQYQRLVGKLIYLSHTRPDIAFAVSVISQFMHSPKKKHLDAVYEVLRYLKGTLGKGLFFKRGNDRMVEIYTDADWEGSLVDRRSTSDYCTYVWGNLVTWRSKKQSVVPRSSAEAEFRALAHGWGERDMGMSIV